MRVLDFIHRWTGGLLGLLLAVLGLTGTLMVHKDVWLRATLPHAADRQITDQAAIAAAVERMLADPLDRPATIVLASHSLGVHRLVYGPTTGSYNDQAGQVVARWSSVWGRPEIWVFDLHRHLLAADVGEAVGGVVGLVGLGFVVSGGILWWRTRRNFKFRLLPKRLSRSSIVRHHRDLGIVVAPLLFLSMLTGSMLALRPVASLLLRPLSSPTEMAAARAPPAYRSALPPANLPWRTMLDAARARFPEAEVRVISLPQKPGDLLAIRLRQPGEWLPNGGTTVWIDPADARVVATRDAFEVPLGLRAFNLAYPAHAAKVGGLAYQLVMTMSGLALTLLGTLAVFSFWVKMVRLRRTSAQL